MPFKKSKYLTLVVIIFKIIKAFYHHIPFEGESAIIVSAGADISIEKNNIFNATYKPPTPRNCIFNTTNTIPNLESPRYIVVGEGRPK